MVITPPWRKLMVVAGIAAAIGLAGCSGGPSSSGVASIDGSGSTSTSNAAGSGSGGNGQGDASEQDAMVKFAQCMRQHGVDMPDPKPAAGGGGMAEAVPGAKADDPAAVQKMQAASTACQKLLPNGGKPTQQDIQRQLKFAQCMRAHGVDIPDPTPNGGGNRISINASDPKTKAAFAACEPTGTGSTSGK